MGLYKILSGEASNSGIDASSFHQLATSSTWHLTSFLNENLTNFVER
jgi:hypothetical protein